VITAGVALLTAEKEAKLEIVSINQIQPGKLFTGKVIAEYMVTIDASGKVYVLNEKGIVREFASKDALVKALEARNLEYERMEGEAVFYGPKIDIKIKDVLGRYWQCSTIQFDFNLPERFDMTFIGEDGKEVVAVGERVTTKSGL
jgi:hypothetical protein